MSLGRVPAGARGMSDSRVAQQGARRDLDPRANWAILESRERGAVSCSPLPRCREWYVKGGHDVPDFVKSIGLFQSVVHGSTA